MTNSYAPLREDRLRRLLPGRDLLRLEEVNSTLTQMKRFAAAGARDGAVLVAECQTAGRGRLGRAWSAPKGAGLTFSYLVRRSLPAAHAARLAPAFALGVCEGLRDLGIGQAGVKWPNDVVVDGRKICGMLCEMELDPAGGLAFVQAGIGINVHPFPLPEELREKACFAASYIRANREELLAAVVGRLDRFVSLACEDFPALLDRYRQRCLTLGRQVRASGGQCAEGLAVDVNGEGELLVKTVEGELVALRTADVSVRGLLGYV